MKFAVIAGIICIVIAAFVPAIYFYSKFKAAETIIEKNPVVAQQDVKDILAKVSKLIDLPTDETPTIATVSDVDKLHDQPFFAKAKNGDKVLIYTKAKKAILYDPTANKILEVGPLLTPSTTPTATGSATISISPAKSKAANASDSATANSDVKVVLYNGTPVTGLTTPVEKILKDKFPNVTIVDKDTAVKKDYAKTLVIDLDTKKKEDADAIAKALNADISSLPAGETKPADAEVLIIVGLDKK
jgi:hypothetical protein